MSALDLEVPHVYPHTGDRECVLEYSLASLFEYPPVAGTAPPVLVVFRVEQAEVDAFGWKAEGVAVRPGEPVIPFVAAADSVVALYEDFKIDAGQRPKWLKPGGTGRFCAAVLPTDRSLRLTLTVKTERPEVAELAALLADMQGTKAQLQDDPENANARDAATRAAVAFGAAFKKIFSPITVNAFGRRAKGAAGTDLDRALVLRAKPDLKPTPGYPGYVGIDLGNTSTTLAYMPEGKSDVKSIALFQLDAVYKRDALTTAVKVTRLAAAATGPAAAARDEWDAGEPAIRGTATGALVLGAKRMLADPGAAPHRVWLDGGGTRLMPKTLPSELFLAAVVRAFHGRHTSPDDPDQRWHVHAPRAKQPELMSPGLAVTCPTTFTDREIAALRRAVLAGWRRATGLPADAPADGAIALVLDEASAAGMYFTYRDFILGPGFARTLHALYPHGLNMLVYDCGGGTTDIALINVFAAFDDAQDRVARLHIDVIGRSGHRTFGGDNITEAVFRIVKAKVALKAAQKLQPNNAPPPFALRAAEFAADLAAAAETIERFVPTRFDRQNPGLESNRVRAAAVLELWYFVEELKQNLGKDEQAALKYPKLNGLFANLLRVAHAPTLQANQIGTMIGEVTVTRKEVEALVWADARASVEKANGVLRRKFGPPDDPNRDEEPAAARARLAGEVHKVYVLGNSSLYPLVRQEIEGRLEVRFLLDTPAADGTVTPGRLVFPSAKKAAEKADDDGPDVADLKGAVAKGAAAALRMQHEVEGLEVTFDDALSRRLLFDVWFADYGDAPLCLYREGELYTKLQDERIAPPTGGDTPAARSKVARLKRQWPDERKQENYLDFTFTEPWVGPLLVHYENEEGGQRFADGTPPPYFTMTDEGSGETVIGVEVAYAAYISPPQSGKL